MPRLPGAATSSSRPRGLGVPRPPDAAGRHPGSCRQPGRPGSPLGGRGGPNRGPVHRHRGRAARWTRARAARPRPDRGGPASPARACDLRLDGRRGGRPLRPASASGRDRRVPESRRPCRVDALLFDQLLTNLVDNAARHAPPAAPLPGPRARARGREPANSSSRTGGPACREASLAALFAGPARWLAGSRVEAEAPASGSPSCRGFARAMGVEVCAAGAHSAGWPSRSASPRRRPGGGVAE